MTLDLREHAYYLDSLEHLTDGNFVAAQFEAARAVALAQHASEVQSA